MADTKISALPSATTPLAGTEVVPLVQSSTTKNVAVSDLTAGRSVSGASFVPTGSSVPANGMYLSASNTVALSTNSTIRGLFDPNGNWSAGYSGSVTGVGNMFSNNDYTTAYAANLGANAANFGYGSQGTFRSGSNSSTTSGISLITRATGLSRWDILNVWTANYLGDLVFRARTGGSTTAEIVRFKSNTDVSIAAGNLVIGTSGKGISTGSAIPLGFGTNTSTSGMTLDTSNNLSVTGSVTANVQVKSTNATSTTQKYVIEKVYELYKGSGPTTLAICDITSSYASGGMYVEVSVTGQFSDFDGLSGSHLTAMVIASTASSTEISRVDGSQVGPIGISSVSSGVVRISLTTVRSSVLNGVAYVKVVCGNASSGSDVEPSGVTIS